jgi:hypothetical protein
MSSKTRNLISSSVQAIMDSQSQSGKPHSSNLGLNQGASPSSSLAGGISGIFLTMEIVGYCFIFSLFKGTYKLKFQIGLKN